MNLDAMIIKEVSHILLAHSPKGRTDRMHNRPCYGLSFTNEGVITYKHKGKSYVSDKNHAVILPKGQSYNIHRQEAGDFTVINFECDRFFTDTIIVLPVKDIEPVMNEFKIMRKLFMSDKNRFIIISYLYKIFYQLTNHSQNISTPLSPALSYIDQHYGSAITNEILAKACSFSEDYFRKQFKKTYGISPKQYLIDKRIDVAKQLLTEGAQKIHTISKQCGFSNPYNFCRIFKEKTGVTPTEYKKENKVYY